MFTCIWRVSQGSLWPGTTTTKQECDEPGSRSHMATGVFLIVSLSVLRSVQL
ncbi:uncharacterized protein L969DRAFT_51506 [Mixia osmundae IAM 14324]|uniref:Uncharacterized protein n=1 Tax=Mixia osmundae (strain CBS 9802 / IAM 14324 / JCM 22182 / KY 12970) TaxID=764103 RepID=G7DWR3_MIXOS|nr:uncharacterized protein L969DRAFT_97556 [Mixia osmundae IAM 14324]XP_014566737.1 uncharacterized protein L969DRAFT_51506 [Mixia osmundae IAM 14324]KEI36212.1 hypothetical protein L969DRAFT_97556 [Mixia osmundae IAM 14324]KEI38180.1 hypothetical protein L969DRAFT_51506 [Mixia osmundae IAM 14324]GAA95010.1 hypothetical protein E5Q_01665 [Mixia osmundae IAM 14324]